MDLTPNEAKLTERFSAHEAQCEERWKTIFARLEAMEGKLDKLYGIAATASGTIIMFLGGIILTILHG